MAKQKTIMIKVQRWNINVSGSDFRKTVKSRSRILNMGLGISASLGFYHSIALIARLTGSMKKANKQRLCELTHGIFFEIFALC